MKALLLVVLMSLSLMGGNDNTDHKAAYIQQLDSIEAGLEDLAPLYQGTTMDMKQVATETYERWDKALNDIYSALNKKLSSSEMDKLKEEQLNWIKERDYTAKEASLVFEGGTMESLEYISTLASLTKERCYELVERYIQ